MVRITNTFPHLSLSIFPPTETQQEWNRFQEEGKAIVHTILLCVLRMVETDTENLIKL